MSDDQDGCEWVKVSPGVVQDKRPLNDCVCVSALSITAVRRSSIETSAERLQLTGSAAPSTGMTSRSYNGSQVACGPFEHSYLHHRLPAVP